MAVRWYYNYRRSATDRRLARIILSYKNNRQVFRTGRLFLCLAISTKRIAKTEESSTWANNSNQAFDGYHKQILHSEISTSGFLCKQRSQSSGKGLTAYRYGSTEIYCIEYSFEKTRGIENLMKDL